MSPKARKRAAVVALLALIAGGVLAFGQVTGTFAIFNAETDNANSAVNGSWIPKPTSGSSSLNGSPYLTEHLAWTSGSTTAMPGGAANPVTGQSLYYADGGTGGSASCGSYSSFSSLTAGATTADVQGTNLTHWWCFEAFSTSTSATTSGSWTSDVVTFTPRQILVPTSFTTAPVAAGNHAGSLEQGDSITITYNQAVSYSGGNVTVCAFISGVILIGDASCAADTDTPTIGKITGLSIPNAARTYTGSTVTPSSNTLKIVVGAGNSNGRTAVTGSGPFTGAGTTVTGAASQPQCSSNPTCSTASVTVGF